MFHASRSTSLPPAPHGSRIDSIRFETCPGSSLVVRVAQIVDASLCSAGVPSDMWLLIRCDRLPDRFVRLTRGAHSLFNLLTRYGFQEGIKCVNHDRMTLHYVLAKDPPPNIPLTAVPGSMRDATGVPQFFPRSGICWYNALCWTSFSDPSMREFIRSHFPEDMRELCDRCLYDREAALTLREQIWHRFKAGDDISLPPEMDGRNGGTEFLTICAKLKVPVLRYEEHHGRLVLMDASHHDRAGTPCALPECDVKRKHVLMVRFVDGSHEKKFRVPRETNIRGRTYRLMGIYFGQQKCGHQIAIGSTNGDWRHWGIADADLHKDGIGPIFVHFDDEWKDFDKWYDAWEELILITKFGRNRENFCSMGIKNSPDDSLDQYRIYGRSSSRVGSNSQDWMYLHDPAW